MDRRLAQDLDNYITGHYGEDQFKDEDYQAAYVGQPATIHIGSDCYPATVIKVTSRTVVVQEDSATRTDTRGISEQQDYRYERDLQGKTTRFYWMKHGYRNGPYVLTLGERRMYRDPSF